MKEVSKAHLESGRLFLEIPRIQLISQDRQYTTLGGLRRVPVEPEVAAARLQHCHRPTHLLRGRQTQSEVSHW